VFFVIFFNRWRKRKKKRIESIFWDIWESKWKKMGENEIFNMGCEMVGYVWNGFQVGEDDDDMCFLLFFVICGDREKKGDWKDILRYLI